MHLIFGNFTLLSAIFDLILINSYRTCNLNIDRLLKTTLTSDVKEVILRESMKFHNPWIVAYINETAHRRFNDNDQNLNVFLVNDSGNVGNLNSKTVSSTNVILLLKKTYFDDDDDDDKRLDSPSITKHLENENTQIFQVDESLRAREIYIRKEEILSLSLRRRDNVNYHRGTINVTFDVAPPNNLVVVLPSSALLVGTDALVLCEILIKLNATPVYYNKIYSENRIGLSNDAFYKEEVRKWLRLRTHSYHLIFDKRMIEYLIIRNTKPIIPELKFSSSYTISNGPMDSLYPHDRSCLVVLYQREDRTISFLKQIFYSSESQLFVCTLLIFWIGRIIIRRVALKDWFSIFFTTVSVHLVQNSISRTKNVFETFWILVFMIFPIFMLSLLAGRIYSNLVNEPVSEPMNLKDLLDTKMDIWIMDHFQNFFESWTELSRTEIRERVSYVPQMKMVEGIGTRHKVAYVLPEGQANLIISSQFKAGRAVYESFNIMRKQYDMQWSLATTSFIFSKDCGLISYEVAKNSPITERVNQIIQNMMENGLIGAYIRWSKSVFKKETQQKIEANNQIAFYELNGIFYMYLVGIALGAFVFLCELTVPFVKKKVLKR